MILLGLDAPVRMIPRNSPLDCRMAPTGPLTGAGAESESESKPRWAVNSSFYIFPNSIRRPSRTRINTGAISRSPHGVEKTESKTRPVRVGNFDSESSTP